MFRTIICITPFMVCLFWLIIFIIGYRRHDPAKKVLTWFLMACSVLYYCHAHSFIAGADRILESVWALCSLSVYPLYHLYIRTLTSRVDAGAKRFLTFIPGTIVFIILVFFPGTAADFLRMAVFMLQVVFVCWSGIRMLRAFDREVASCYANTEGRQTTDVRILMIAFVMTSILSAAVNAIGKSNVGARDALLIPVAILFSVMLFALSYIGYVKQFSCENLSTDMEEDDAPADAPDELLGVKLDKLMDERMLYLEKNLKINDVAAQIGSCRTYLSNYLNQVRGESFSDYVNRLRIERAKKLLQEDMEVKMVTLAEQLGFSNEQGFYRNFKKFTGMTPSQWKQENESSRHSERKDARTGRA